MEVGILELRKKDCRCPLFKRTWSKVMQKHPVIIHNYLCKQYVSQLLYFIWYTNYKHAYTTLRTAHVYY